MSDLEIIQGVPFVFYGEVFNAYLASDRQWYLPLNDVCRALDLEITGQRQRVQRDEAISDRLVNIPLETPYQDTTRVQDVACLNLRALPYWLGTIDSSRVKEEHRKKIILFKREFAEAAWAVFRSDIMPADLLAEMDTHLPPNERDYHETMDQFRRAAQKLALLEGRFDTEVERLGAQLSDLTGRLGTLEMSLAGKQIVNSAQAQHIQELIAAVADSMYAKTQKARSMCFAITHDDFKSAFQIPIYSFLPAEQMQAAIAYLGARWSFYNPGKPLPDVFSRGNQPALF